MRLVELGISPKYGLREIPLNTELTNIFGILFDLIRKKVTLLLANKLIGWLRSGDNTMFVDLLWKGLSLLLNMHKRQGL